MAVYEPEHGRIVIRVVYDGPGRAGKTTNIEQLARLFGGDDPDLQLLAADNGHTTYFDWLSFDGGVIDGHKLLIQIVGVPGAKRFEHRRAQILRTADAVVLVCDSTPGTTESARETLDSQREHLGKRAAGVPVIVQANKQDLPNALQAHEVGAALGLPYEVPVIGAEATAGIGTRETAVHAIRAAVRLVKRRTAKPGIASIAGMAGTLASLRASLDSAAVDDPEPDDVDPAELVAVTPGSPGRKVARPTTIDEPHLLYVHTQSPTVQAAKIRLGEPGDADPVTTPAPPRAGNRDADAEPPRPFDPAETLPSHPIITDDPPEPPTGRGRKGRRRDTETTEGRVQRTRKERSSSESTARAPATRNQPAAPSPSSATRKIPPRRQPNRPPAVLPQSSDIPVPRDRPPSGVITLPGDRPPSSTVPSPSDRPGAVQSPTNPPPGIVPIPAARSSSGAVQSPGDRPPSGAVQIASDPSGAVQIPGDRRPSGAVQIASDRPPSGAVQIAGDRRPSGAVQIPGDRPPSGAVQIPGDRPPSGAVPLIPAAQTPSGIVPDLRPPPLPVAPDFRPPALVPPIPPATRPPVGNVVAPSGNVPLAGDRPPSGAVPVPTDRPPSAPVPRFRPPSAPIPVAPPAAPAFPRTLAGIPVAPRSTTLPVAPRPAPPSTTSTIPPPEPPTGRTLLTFTPQEAAALGIPSLQDRPGPGPGSFADDLSPRPGYMSPRPAPSEPLPPHPEVPPGHVWPVPGGRAVLKALAALAPPRVPLPAAPDRVLYSAGPFDLSAQSFPDVERALAALHARVRMWLPVRPLLPVGLALAVDSEQGGATRLWRVAPRLAPLLDHLGELGTSARVRVLEAHARALGQALTLCLRRHVVLDLHPAAYAVEHGRVVYLRDAILPGDKFDDVGPALLELPEQLDGDPAIDAFIDALARELTTFIEAESDDLGLAAALSRTTTRVSAAQGARARLLAVLERRA